MLLSVLFIRIINSTLTQIKLIGNAFVPIDHNFYLATIPIILMVGMSKGGFGGGLGMLAVPLMALMIDPRVAAAILLPILCTMDIVGLFKFKGKWDSANLKVLLPGALIGTAFGACSFTYTNSDMIRLLLGLLSLYFVFHFIWGQRQLKSAAKKTGSKASGIFWGSISGFASYIAHAGGPPVAIHLIPQKLAKSTFTSTTIVFFALVNFVKLIPYIVLGQINISTIESSLYLLPLAPIGVLLGIYLHHKVSEALFYRLTCLFLFVAGIKLTYQGLIALV